MKEVRRVSMRKISDLFIVVLLSFMTPILLTNYSFADVKVEKIQTSKVASFSCGGKNANGFTVTPDYYIAACDHSGPINVYKKKQYAIGRCIKKYSWLRISSQRFGLLCA